MTSRRRPKKMIDQSVVHTLHGKPLLTQTSKFPATDSLRCLGKSRRTDSLKQQCKELNVNYWRALKRRASGMNNEKIFEPKILRGERETASTVIVYGIRYPNVESACRALSPIANSTTIGRWIRNGMAVEEAFERIPNPGYADGVIYRVTHNLSGKTYVGLTIQTLPRRWAYHLEQAKAGHIRCVNSLHAAIRKHGEAKFTVEQIDSGTTKVDLERKEREWIAKLKSLAPGGYNISTGGESGGSNKKQVVIDGEKFCSVGSGAQHIVKTRGIGLEAAKARLRSGRIDVRKPAKPGQSLVKTPAYKAWSRIIHCVCNPKSVSYNQCLDVVDQWRVFVNFHADVGQPPQIGMAFTRLDKTRGFNSQNCRWVTKSEASRMNAAFMKANGTLTGRTKSRR